MMLPFINAATNIAAPATITVSAEPVEVRLSGLRMVDRRPSTGSGLTDMVAANKFADIFIRGNRI